MFYILKQKFKIAKKNIKYFFKCILAFFKYRKTNKQNIFIIGSPAHGNRGDIAIALAQYKILKKNFPKAIIYDVSGKEYFTDYRAIRRICKPSDIITFIGGGNFGNQYMLEENIRRHALKLFPENKIIMFPQSIFYTLDEIGKKEKNISQDIYSTHKHLTLTARDPYSFQMIKDWFPNNKVLHTPDIVLYFECNKNLERKGVLMCMRNDLEGIISIEDKTKIEVKLKTIFSKVIYNDTSVDCENKKYDREHLLEEKLNEFASSELVITDRMHGMVFAAITGTPCIALPNYNHKVKGEFEWLEHLGYIKYAKNLEEILKLIDEIKPQIGVKHNYSNKSYLKYFDKIIEICCE